MAKYYIVAEFDVDGPTALITASFAAQQIKDGPVDFDVQDVDGKSLGKYSTTDFTDFKLG
jgi:hypothetical protein